MQTWPSLQALPHVPQLASSVSVSVQPPAQHSWPSAQTMQAPPLVPQAPFVSPVSHVVPSQQPPAHLWPSQTHAPPAHRWPVPHETQTPPPLPHAPSASPLLHVEPSQQPAAQLWASQGTTGAVQVPSWQVPPPVQG